MKAVLMHDYGDSSVLRYENAPDPTPQPGEVLVRVHFTSVNPVDWMLRSGSLRDLIPIKLPFILGNDVAGIVESVGAGVSGFSTGDRVMAFAFNTQAELCVVKAEHLVFIPEGLSLQDAAALLLVNLTGDQLVRLGAKAASGQTVIVTGALGGVGRSAVFAAVAAGSKVIAGVRGKRLAEACRLPGVQDVFAMDDSSAIESLPLVDAIADTVGGDCATQLIQKLKPHGRFGCFPSTREAIGHHANIEINSVYAQADKSTTLRYAEAVRNDRLSIPIGRVMPLAEAANALEIAEKGANGKVILQIS